MNPTDYYFQNQMRNQQQEQMQNGMNPAIANAQRQMQPQQQGFVSEENGRQAYENGRSAPRSENPNGNAAYQALRGGADEDMENDPIFRGTRKAMEATRRLIAPSENQRKAAMWEGVAKTFQGLGESRSKGMVGKLLEAANAYGVPAYGQGLKTSTDENINYLNRADKMMAGMNQKPKVGNILTAQGQLNTLISNKRAAREKYITDWISTIEPNKREEALPQIEKYVDQKLMEEFDGPINGLLAQAQAHGIDLVGANPAIANVPVPSFNVKAMSPEQLHALLQQE